MKVAQIQLTPQKAQEYLLSKPDLSRKLNLRRVQIIADAILRGEWKLTHQGLGIDDDGLLVDGAHRCAAAVRANRTIPIMLATGVDPDSYKVIDIGAKRSPADQLAIAGYGDNAALIAPTIRIVYAYRQDWFDTAPWEINTLLQSVTPTIIIDEAEQHPLLHGLVPVSRRITKGIGRYGLRSGVLAAVLIIAEDANNFTGLREEWVSALADGFNLAPGSPLAAWRKWALTDVRRTRPEVLCTLIKSWNAWQRGQEITQMRVTRGERMPSVQSALPESLVETRA